jgi:hypothetical protein
MEHSAGCMVVRNIEDVDRYLGQVRDAAAKIHLWIALFIWEGGNVGVYIDNIPNGWVGGGAIYNAICQGIQTWGVIDGRTYTCHSSTGSPSPTTPAPYVFVSSNSSGNSFTNMDGTIRDNRQPIRSGPDLKVQVAYMTLQQPLPTSNLVGLAAHEMGHLHHFENCGLKNQFGLGSGCQCGGSLMGPQPSNGAGGN